MENETKNISTRTFLLGMAAGAALLAAAFLIFGRGMLPGLVNEPRSAVTSDAPAADAKTNEIIQYLDKYYVGEYDREDLMRGMYTGLVYGVGDPYTSYMDRTAFTRYLEGISGEYTGVGLTVTADTEANAIEVVAPFEGFSAANAGVLPGDRIESVDGQAVNGTSLDQAVNMMRGEAGTTVSVTFFRPSDGSKLELELERQVINVPTVEHKMMDNGVAYIRITQFDDVTLNQFKTAYETCVSSGMKGLILDLRNNPGGLLRVVNEISDILVPKGVIVYTEDKGGSREYTYSDAEAVEVPLLVLVNGNSASASEVLSGAVKDHGVGELVGTTTFGKGLVQNMYQLTDGSALKITIAKYYTPNGVCIQGIGLEPDYEIEMSDELSVKISSLTLEEDVQLAKALEIMKGKLE